LFQQKYTSRETQVLVQGSRLGCRFKKPRRSDFLDQSSKTKFHRFTLALAWLTHTCLHQSYLCFVRIQVDQDQRPMEEKMNQWHLLARLGLEFRSMST
jgi:hypothetical protein